MYLANAIQIQQQYNFCFSSFVLGASYLGQSGYIQGYQRVSWTKSKLHCLYNEFIFVYLKRDHNSLIGIWQIFLEKDAAEHKEKDWNHANKIFETEISGSPLEAEEIVESIAFWMSNNLSFLKKFIVNVETFAFSGGWWQCSKSACQSLSRLDDTFDKKGSNVQGKI